MARRGLILRSQQAIWLRAKPFLTPEGKTCLGCPKDNSNLPKMATAGAPCPVQWQQALLATCLIPVCVGRGLRLVSESRLVPAATLEEVSAEHRDSELKGQNKNTNISSSKIRSAQNDNRVSIST